MTPRLTSLVCRRAHWDTPWFARWHALFADAAPPGGHFVPPHIAFHRKVWEWAAICQALDERGLLAPGMKGCGFAVGREPLASVFARLGVDVLATDLAASEAAAGIWSGAGQHAASLDALHWEKVVDRPTFDARVRFLPQDMRALRPAELGLHDFIWSSCSLEHLGDLEAGLDFILRSTALLRPGGIAVHTTEFNLSDVENTILAGDSVIYRRKDLDALAARLRGIGCGMEALDDFPGTAPEDIEYDYPPYYGNDRAHIKLLLGGFVATSCLLIVAKGRPPAMLPPPPAPAALPGSPIRRVLAPARALARRLRAR